MPYNNARQFRQGLPGENIRSNFPVGVPNGLYGRNNPSPFSFKLPTGYQLPAITPQTTLPLGGVAEDGPNGQRLPVGAPVEGDVPGLYESGPSRSGAPPQSPYTLTSAPGVEQNVGSKLNDPAFQQSGTNGTALALAQIYGAPTGLSGGGTGAGGGNARAPYNPVSEMGNAGRVLEAANGLESQRVAYSAREQLGGDGWAYNRQGQRLDTPSGGPLASDKIVSPFDPPEVRASKQRYADIKIRELAAADPTLARNGVVPTTQDLAGRFQTMMAEGRRPKLVNLGFDSSGRPVEGTMDPNGNFSRIVPEKEKPIEDHSGPEISRDGKFFKSGDAWHPMPNENEKPLDPLMWSVAGKPGGTYEAYLASKKAKPAAAVAPLAPFSAPSTATPAAQPAPGAAPASEQNAQPPAKKTAEAQPVYHHTDVLAELQRRGLIRK